MICNTRLAYGDDQSLRLLRDPLVVSTEHDEDISDPTYFFRSTTFSLSDRFRKQNPSANLSRREQRRRVARCLKNQEDPRRARNV